MNKTKINGKRNAVSKSEVEGRANIAPILLIIALLFPIILIMLSTSTSAAPNGVTIVSNITEQPDATPATSLTTAGGTFTTLVLNGTFQNPRWKAYVGNISGTLQLADANSNRIYNWNLTSISGEVYLSRNSSITWANINCSNITKISAEQTYLTMNSSSIDNINYTFNYTTHRSFYVGTKYIPNSYCRSTFTYINNVSQTVSENALFQEILLSDGTTNIIYATLLNDNTVGYDGSSYDFQIIVPEDDTKTTPTPYYFFAEIG